MSSQAQAVRIGSKFVLQEDSPSRLSTVVFEDDGETGYFYALAPTSSGELELLDALHIYNAEADLRDTDIRLELLWDEQGTRAGLRINASLWAAFDFDSETGWSRSNFPPPAGRWQMAGARPDWSDEIIKLF